MTYFDMTSNVSSMKYAQKLVPGLFAIGVPPGGEVMAGTGLWGKIEKIALHHVDQREKLKGLDG